MRKKKEIEDREQDGEGKRKDLGNQPYKFCSSSAATAMLSGTRDREGERKKGLIPIDSATRTNLLFQNYYSANVKHCSKLKFW